MGKSAAQTKSRRESGLDEGAASNSTTRKLSTKPSKAPKADVTRHTGKAASKGKGKAVAHKRKDDDDEFEPASDNDIDEEEDELVDDPDEEDSDKDSAAGEANLEDDGEELLVVDAADKKPSKKSKVRKSTGGPKDGIKETGPVPLDESLPPLITLDAIFKDLVGNVQQPLLSLVDKLDGRSLRVGTMCSGTESPLLALGLISNSLQALTGKSFNVEHIFSCEIEPFKQAYIERNFSPPLLFRDVTELGEDEALTAYGGLAKVPGDIDMLVAGTSCVDYSPLNTKKKTIDARGESGRTFFGMMDYVVKHKPSIVILENVSGAPWDEVVERFGKIDYDATFIRLDTKHYYIPHTRSRGYLIAVPKRPGSQIVEKWADKVKALSRPCSSPLEAFLLSTDDPRIHRARQELAADRQNKDGTKRATVDWIRCESRHAQARDQEMLGLGRPLTAWQDNGGSPTMPDGAWNDWASVQTERVLDLMDISFLRLAIKGTDVTYKSAIWNLSQNVDRTTASVKLGICPCLTPNMIPYLASRGGPIVGLEALALQGLPIDELLLTRENTDQLADLAGNAMSSTVVGAAILAALSVAHDTLVVRQTADQDTVMADAESTTSNDEVAKRIRGLNRLVDHAVDLASFAAPAEDLFERAHSSARKCICEGRNETSPLEIYACRSCEHTSCAACRGRPQHRYELDVTPRLSPSDFEAEFKSILPMRFRLQGFSEKQLKKRVMDLYKTGLRVSNPATNAGVQAYLAAVAAAVDQQEFHFQRLTRRTEWSATFKTANATLELQLGLKGAKWSLYVHAEPSLAVGDVLRKRLCRPVARLQVFRGAKDLLKGSWQLSVPVEQMQDATITVETIGDLVASWRSELGLVTFVDEKRPAKIRVTASEPLSRLLDRSVDGVYQLEANCGTACNSLHRRLEPAEGNPLYLFLDPSRSGEPVDDPYVFAEHTSRLDFGEARQEIVSFIKSWRPPTIEGSSTVRVDLTSHWTELEGAKIDCTSASVADATFSTLPGSFDLTAGVEACSFADCLLSASVYQSAEQRSAAWAQPHWHEVDLQHEGPEVFSKISWMLARIPEWDAFKEWQPVSGENLASDCDTCCPRKPTIQWVKRTEQKPKSIVTSIVAIEDGVQAAVFEKALKARPSPLLVHTRQIDDSFQFRVGLNVATLAHKAIGSLPVHQDDSNVTVTWRLKLATSVELSLGRDNVKRTFTLPSNRADLQAPQPPHFVQAKLRPEQLRSLTWMIAQETKPQAWIEEEVAEAVLPQVGWHAEAKASRNVVIRGGVVADEVGYGKTAITIGLISSRLSSVKLPEKCDRVPVKATLIVIPPHLCSQWPSEIKKFTKGSPNGGLKVITIKDVADLKRNSIEDVQKADVVVIADSVFKSQLYWPQLGDWSASVRGVKYDQRAGRYFRICVEEALEALPDQVRLLQQEDGPKKVLSAINAARKARSKKQDVVVEPSKRLKGQAALFAQEKAAYLAKNGGKSKAPASAPKQSAEAKMEVPSDPWELGTSAVAKDWTKMKAPPLAMFRFERLVVDEFTYSDGPQLAAIHSIQAQSRWILSGTPPLKSFAEIKTIANLLHVHLGIDDDSEGSTASRDARSKEKTAAEQFHSFRDVHTAGWHRRRDDVAQAFLDLFARQNIAEIDDIPYSEEVVQIELPAAEMAIYRELEHHLLALAADLGKIQKIKKEKKGDREVRLSEALGESRSPEEALLKRCSHFSLDMDEETAALKDAPHVCDKIVAKRTAQLEECISQLKEMMHTTALQHRHCEKYGYYKGQEGSIMADVRHFKEFVKSIFNSVKDEEAKATLSQVAEEIGCKDGKIGPTPPDAPAPKHMTTFLRKNGDPIREMDNEGRVTTIVGKKVPQDEFEKSKTWIVRQNVSILQRLVKELIGRYRSKRYFECVRSAQRNENDDWQGVAILSSCGHKGPLAQVREAAIKGKCIHKSCDARVGTTNIVLGSSLGVEAESGSFGVKLETLVNIILDEIPKQDKVLVFCQFDDLFDKVLEALETYGIPTAVLSGTATSKGKILEKFQDPKDVSDRVLLLRVTDASASGANLTVANWAFFVSPLLTESKQQYKAFETQAIGRLRRYGQLNTVKVFRLLTHSTIDIDIFEERLDCKVDDILARQQPRQLKYEKREKVQEFVVRKQVVMAAKKKAGKGKNKVAIVDDDDDIELDEGALSESEAEFSGDETSDDEAPKNKNKQTKSAGSDAGLKENLEPKIRPKRTSSAAALFKTVAMLDETTMSSDDEVDDKLKSSAVRKGRSEVEDSDEYDDEQFDTREQEGAQNNDDDEHMRVDDESAAASTVAASDTFVTRASNPRKRASTFVACAGDGKDAGDGRSKMRKSGSFVGVFVPPLTPQQRQSMLSSPMSRKL
ncbi:hypothetical protein OIO90_005943 [Microbotryomycetes sp. JL221]|nr:hypothetical protein OIO90_005943 [Microbotryomycetes sp. JL221]